MLGRTVVFLLYISLFIGNILPQSAAQQPAELAELELITAKSAGWVFAIGQTPKLVWRDCEAATRLGLDSNVKIRWFDREFVEADSPSHAGRWLALVDQPTAEFGPFRRGFTFLAIPPELDSKKAPNLEIEFPKYEQPETWPVWNEHREEVERVAKDLLFRGLLDNQHSAVLLANILESPVRDRPARFLESSRVANARTHLQLQARIFPDLMHQKTLAPPYKLPQPAAVLHLAAPESVGVSPAAKQRIDDYCRQWQSATQEPFVVLIAQRGVIITHEAFGMDDRGTPIPLDYRCWIASLTKTVTGIMVSQFLDQGLMELDWPLQRIFREYPDDPNIVPTVRQCLNHTAGLSTTNDFGGMLQPQLENHVLNGLNSNRPGSAYAYSGLGFELVAKAMERITGQTANDLYQTHLFEPLGFGDVILGNAGSDAHLTAWELAVLGQWLANRGSYGDLKFISPDTFASLLPRPLNLPGVEEYGVGLNWIRHSKPGRPDKSSDPNDWLFSGETIGHGSMSGCILIVDLERQLVIVQARREYRDADNRWWKDFFPLVIRALDGDGDLSYK